MKGIKIFVIIKKMIIIYSKYVLIVLAKSMRGNRSLSDLQSKNYKIGRRSVKWIEKSD